jgi:hypothetical protein
VIVVVIVMMIEVVVDSSGEMGLERMKGLIVKKGEDSEGGIGIREG